MQEGCQLSIFIANNLAKRANCTQTFNRKPFSNKENNFKTTTEDVIIVLVIIYDQSSLVITLSKQP